MRRRRPGSPSVWPTCSRRDGAVRDVDRPQPGVVGAPDVVEEPVADVDAARRVGDADRLHRRPERALATASSTGSRWCRRRRRSGASTPSRSKKPSCQARGQIVLDSTPTLIPSARSASHIGPHLGVGEGVRLPELVVRRRAARGRARARPRRTGRRPSRSAGGRGSAPRSRSPAACRRGRVISSASWCGAFTTAWASASDSAWKSMSCQRVRVPPQSKMTASIGHGSAACADPMTAAGEATDLLGEPGGLVERDEGQRVGELDQAGVRERRRPAGAPRSILKNGSFGAQHSSTGRSNCRSRVATSARSSARQPRGEAR